MWHYVENGQQVGPVTAEQMAQLLAEGKINGDTLVWQPGQENWRPYREFLPAGEAPPQENPSAPGQAETVCAECGKIFPIDETIRHGNVRVCAACKPVFLQKLAEGAKINTGQLNYAGFGTRFAAKFLDGLILGVPFMVIFFVVLIPQIRTSGGQPSEQLQFLPMLMQGGFILVQLAYNIFFLGRFGATLGKMACKIKVVTATGEPIGYSRATGRCFAEILSGMVCYIGYLLVLFDKEERRALHDRICNTRVVMK
jgi:uncharacterized RDD family membrane protein YckC